MIAVKALNRAAARCRGPDDCYLALRAKSPAALAVFTDSLELFGIGASWGGFESLVVPAACRRTASKPVFEGMPVRLHIGLEDPQDIIADLEQALQKMRAAG